MYNRTGIPLKLTQYLKILYRSLNLPHFDSMMPLHLSVLSCKITVIPGWASSNTMFKSAFIRGLTSSQIVTLLESRLALMQVVGTVQSTTKDAMILGTDDRQSTRRLKVAETMCSLQHDHVVIGNQSPNRNICALWELSTWKQVESSQQRIIIQTSSSQQRIMIRTWRLA